VSVLLADLAIDFSHWLVMNAMSTEFVREKVSCQPKVVHKKSSFGQRVFASNWQQGSLYEPPRAYCAEMRAWANTVAKLPDAVLPSQSEETKSCPVEG